MDPLILSATIGVIAVVFGFFINGVRAAIDDSSRRQDDNHGALKSMLDEFRSAFDKHEEKEFTQRSLDLQTIDSKVSKDEFYRELGRFEKQLEQVRSDSANRDDQLDKKLDLVLTKLDAVVAGRRHGD